MAKDPAFLFYPGDYLRDTQCLSANSQTAYDRIMCEHMRNICISQQQLNFFTKRLTPDEKEELMMVLFKSDNGYQIEWVVESIKKRKAYSHSRSNNRSGKYKNISNSYDNHMENENVIINENKNKDNIPSVEEFLNHALTKEPLVSVSSVKLKYEAWKEAGWKNGNGKKIINWKSNLNNTLPYLPKEKYKTTKEENNEW